MTTPAGSSAPGWSNAASLNQRGWTAIVLAGERPEGDLLAIQSGVPAKALIPVAGRTLLSYVLTALLGSRAIKRIVVLAQDVAALETNEGSTVLAHERVVMVRSSNTIGASILAIAGTTCAPWPVLVTTADNPLLTPERIAAFIEQVGRADIAIGVAERRIVEAEFPHTKRTWLKFRDGHFSGANLFALTAPECRAALERWTGIEHDRKKGAWLLASLGPWLLVRALTRTITFAEALKRVARTFGCSAVPVMLDAEAPIDVDKPSDLELVRQIIAARST